MYRPLKHYVYVSDVKVEQYYAQIQLQPSLLARIAAELTIDLKVLGQGISVKLTREQTEKTRYDKLRMVVKYLEDHQPSDIGSVDAPSAYFKGTLPMYWGKIPTGNKMVFFGGSTEQTLLVLGGSGYHVIGKIGDATIGEPSSDLPSLITLLDEELELQPRLPDREDFDDEDAALNAIEVMVRQMKGIAQHLEFLAKRLAYDPSSSLAHGRARRRSKHVLFGTPIYVALAE